MRYISYRGTQYQKAVIIPEKKSFSGRRYKLAEVFPNYGGYKGHKIALSFARNMRALGEYKARVEAHSGYTVVYIR